MRPLDAPGRTPPVLLPARSRAAFMATGTLDRKALDGPDAALPRKPAAARSPPSVVVSLNPLSYWRVLGAASTRSRSNLFHDRPSRNRTAHQPRSGDRRRRSGRQMERRSGGRPRGFRLGSPAASRRVPRAAADIGRASRSGDFAYQILLVHDLVPLRLSD